MNLNPATVLEPGVPFSGWDLEECGVYFYLGFVWLSVGAGVGVQRRVAPEIPQSTARQRQHRHYHSAAHTATAADHHPECDPPDDGTD